MINHYYLFVYMLIYSYLYLYLINFIIILKINDNPNSISIIYLFISILIVNVLIGTFNMSLVKYVDKLLKSRNVKILTSTSVTKIIDGTESTNSNYFPFSIKAIFVQDWVHNFDHQNSNHDYLLLGKLANY